MASAVRAGRSEASSVEQMADAIDLELFRDTFEREPAHRPWKDRMRMLVERGVLKLNARASPR